MKVFHATRDGRRLDRNGHGIFCLYRELTQRRFHLAPSIKTARRSEAEVGHIVYFHHWSPHSVRRRRQMPSTLEEKYKNDLFIAYCFLINEVIN